MHIQTRARTQASKHTHTNTQTKTHTRTHTNQYNTHTETKANQQLERHKKLEHGLVAPVREAPSVFLETSAKFLRKCQVLCRLKSHSEQIGSYCAD